MVKNKFVKQNKFLVLLPMFLIILKNNNLINNKKKIISTKWIKLIIKMNLNK